MTAENTRNDQEMMIDGSITKELKDNKLGGVLVNTQDVKDIRTAIIKVGSELFFEVKCNNMRKTLNKFKEFKKHGYSVKLTDEQLLSLDDTFEVMLLDKGTGKAIATTMIENTTKRTLLQKQSRMQTEREKETEMIDGSIVKTLKDNAIRGVLVNMKDVNDIRTAILKVGPEMSFEVKCDNKRKNVKQFKGFMHHGYSVKLTDEQLLSLDDEFEVTLIDKETGKNVKTVTIENDFKVALREAALNPKVSVIVTSYNNGEYLVHCLQSLSAQTLKEIEIICVDDCSTDGSQDLIKRFADADPRFKYLFHEKNLSASKVRKDGILLSKGTYIMFVDGDDALEADACKIAYETIVEKRTDIVQFGTTINNIANVNVGRIGANQRMVEPYGGILLNEDLINAVWIEKKFGFQLWNKIYDGNIVRKVATYVDDGYYPKAQDLYLFFLIAYFSRSYFGFSKKLYQYNFGIGCTGSDVLEGKKYKVMLEEANIVFLLRKFVQLQGNASYERVINLIEENFINECFSKWNNYVDNNEKSICFTEFCEAFSFQKVICFLAKKMWYNRSNVTKLLLGMEYFAYIKRNKKRKTIAAYYRSIKNGGAQRVVAMLCNRWAEMKDSDGNYLYNIVCVTDDCPEEGEYPLSEKVQRAFVHNRLIYIKEKYVERLQDWYNIIDKYDVDVVVNSQWIEPASYWDMLAIKAHPRHPAYLIHSHNTCCVPFRNSNELAWDLALRYKFCDGVIALSECDEAYIKSFNGNVKCITNPICFNPKEISKSVYKKNTIVWCGRISWEKQPTDAIRMMKHVVDVIPDAKLLVVGDGSEKILENMIYLCNEFNIVNNVEFIGFTNDVDKYYSKASVFICTSEYEGFCLTIAEALAHHLPVVTYDMPYLPFVIDGRGIITVCQNAYYQMAQEVIDLLQNKKKIEKLGQEAYKHILDVCSSDIENDWKSIFNALDSEEKRVPCKNIYNLVFEAITKMHVKGIKNTITMKDNEWSKKLKMEIAKDD